MAAEMASWWSDHGHDVSLLTLDSSRHDTIPVSAGVTRVGLDLMSDSAGLLSALSANRRRVRALRSALLACRPDHVISLTDRMNVITLLACRGTPLCPIVCERIDIRHHAIGPIWKTLRRLTYPRAKAIVVQTEDIRQAMLPIAGRARVEVIPNCLWTQRRSDPGQVDLSPRTRWIGAVGRLDRQKGFDLLLDAFARIADQRPEWNLVLIGDGPERSRLAGQVDSRQLQQRVLMPGWVENPWESLSRHADVFVLSSRYEGFPNVLLEAMAAGMCPVAFDCPTGPRELIANERSGLLVPVGDSQALADALNRVTGDGDLRSRLADAATGVRERFTAERYFEQWDALLNDTPGRTMRGRQ